MRRFKEELSKIENKIYLSFFSCYNSITKKLNSHKKLVFTSLILIMIFSLSSELFARVGGGGGFGGGSRGGGGRSGGSRGGDGAGILIYFIIRLVIQYPLIGIPLLIVGGFIFFFSGKAGHSSHVSRTIRKARVAPRLRENKEFQALIKKKDPRFTEENMIKRTKSAFIKLQNSWSNQDLKPIRHLVSDGIFERFSVQLEMMQSSKLKNIMQDLTVKDLKIIKIESDNSFDSIHIMVNAKSKDYFIDSEKNRMVYGSKAIEPFSEIWSFLRKPGAQTLSGNGVIEECCPNCGSPLTNYDVVECPACKAIVNSGEYDWVLAEITQASEWNGSSVSNRNSSLNEMIEKDSLFNVQHIEDKVSVIFFRNIASQFFADSKYLAKLAIPQFIEKNRSLYSALENGKHKFYADASIGAVDLLDITLSEDVDGVDEVSVKVTWSGHKEEKNIPSFIKPNFEASSIYEHIFTLQRKSGILSSSKNILTSSHCPSCGAPEAKDNSTKCGYCGTPLNDGSGDWVLKSIEPFSNRAVNSNIFQPKIESSTDLFASESGLSSTQNEEILLAMISILYADGVVDPKEIAMLEKFANSRKISSSRTQQLINTVQEGNVEIPTPDSKGETEELLRGMVMMCLADGKVDNSERQMIAKLMSKTTYSSYDINQFIAKERMTLYKKSKTLLKSYK